MYICKLQLLALIYYLAMKRLHQISFFFAVALLMLSCTNDKEKSRLFLDKGIDYHYHSAFDEAINCFGKAIECDPENFEAYYYRGCAKFNNFRYEESKADFEKAIELNPDYADPYFNLGLYYRDINDMSMACYYFKKAEALGRPSMEDYTKYCDYY